MNSDIRDREDKNSKQEFEAFNRYVEERWPTVQALFTDAERSLLCEAHQQGHLEFPNAAHRGGIIASAVKDLFEIQPNGLIKYLTVDASELDQKLRNLHPGDALVLAMHIRRRYPRTIAVPRHLNFLRFVEQT